MLYKKIKPYEMTETQLRELWRITYCDNSKPILTYDGILVKFFPSMFDHCFYESANRKQKDKSILSYNRLEKMLWIKDTLKDPRAMLKQGWDREKKIYANSRRVAFAKGKYVVVIEFTDIMKAAFVTAYEQTEGKNIHKIQNSPNWIR